MRLLCVGEQESAYCDMAHDLYRHARVLNNDSRERQLLLRELLHHVVTCHLCLLGEWNAKHSDTTDDCHDGL